MSENSVATVVPRRPAPYTRTFHFADPIAVPLSGGPHMGAEIQQPFEWDQLPMALEGVELPTVPNPSTTAFRKNPLSVQFIGVQTSPKLPLVPSTPAVRDASTWPLNFLPGAPSIGTGGPASTTSCTQVLDQTALRLQAQATLARLPSLPKTAQELLLDPSDTNRDTSSESESSGVLEKGDNVVHHTVGDLCLTDRARRSN